jgi:hypothetical protein
LFWIISLIFNYFLLILDANAYITWSKINGDLDDHNAYTDYTRLIISNLNKDSLATYKCTATTNKSSRTRRLNFVDSKSNENIFKLNIEPQIELMNSPNEITIGSDLSLLCDTNGDDAKSVIWTLPNDNENHSYVIQDNILKIEGLSKSNFGRYECSFTRDNIRHLTFFYLTEDVLKPFDSEIIVNGGKYDSYLEIACQSSERFSF